MALLASLPPFPSSSPLTSISPTPPIPLYSLSPSFSSSASSNRRSYVLISRRTAITLLTSSLAAPSLLLSTPVFSVARAETKYDSQLDEDLVVRIFQGASPTVVFIKEYELQNQGKEEDDGKVAGTGSGFVWDRYGHIVTNYHVISKLATDRSGLQRCKVFLEDSNGDTFSREGNLIGFDPAYDLAVLKVDVEVDKLKPALIGTSRNLRVGQSCFAIGNPYGYEHTLTTGVVSGLGREIPSPNGRPIRGAIQTDAAINAGNSGGPLIDSYGHVIGINTATFTRKGTGISSGVNFAIPIDVVVRTVPYLIVYGTSVNNRF